MSKSPGYGSRNRLAGKAYELEIVKELNQLSLFPELGRTEDLNKKLDKKKLDIIPVDPSLFDEFKYRIQAKSTTKVVPYNRLLQELKENFKGMPVVLHKKTERVSDTRFLTEGKYAIMYEEDFIRVVADLQKYKKGYELLSQYWDSISDDEKPNAHKILVALGL